MPHKQPQICDTGCCTQEDVDCCVLAKRADMGTYTYSQLTAGPGARGAYESYVRLYKACTGHELTTGELDFYTMAALTDVSKVIDYDSHGCSHVMGQYTCAPSNARYGFALCSECYTSPGKRPWLYGTFLRNDGFGLTSGLCGLYDLEYRMASRGGAVEWYCVDGTYHRRISMNASYTLQVYGPSGGVCYLFPDLIDGVDYTWSFHGNYTYDWQAVRNDGKAGVILNSAPRGGNSFHVTAWAYEDDADTVSLWNDPYDPLDWFHGTFSLI